MIKKLIIVIIIGFFIFLVQVFKNQKITKDKKPNYDQNINSKREKNKSSCIKVQNKNEEHLKKFALKIGALRFKPGHSIFYNWENNLKIGIRSISEKVQKALDMHPPNFCISILLYPDHASLGRKFREFTETGRVPIAFYSHQTKSIYININEAYDGALAHEIAHGVINFYFKTPPPAKMQEILAMYVDSHLWD